MILIKNLRIQNDFTSPRVQFYKLIDYTDNLSNHKMNKEYKMSKAAKLIETFENINRKPSVIPSKFKKLYKELPADVSVSDANIVGDEQWERNVSGSPLAKLTNEYKNMLALWLSSEGRITSDQLKELQVEMNKLSVDLMEDINIPGARGKRKLTIWKI